MQKDRSWEPGLFVVILTWIGKWFWDQTFYEDYDNFDTIEIQQIQDDENEIDTSD